MGFSYGPRSGGKYTRPTTDTSLHDGLERHDPS